MNKLVKHSVFKNTLGLGALVTILSLISLIFFITSYYIQTTLFQGLAAVIGGAALSVFITLVTSKQAVREQNAREANIARKDTYYIPVFNDLKQIYDLLKDAKQKSLPYPQWVRDMIQRPMVWGKYPMPSFTQWITFKEEPYKSNFTTKAYDLLNQVQAAVSCYNEAVSMTKDSVVEIINPAMDRAFREWAERDDYKRWKEETQGGGKWSSDQYHEWNLYIYRYFQRPTSGSFSEAQSFVWGHNILGWVLADDIEKASYYLQKIYRDDFTTRTTPGTVWFKNIFESVWIELQNLPHIKKFHQAANDLLVKTTQAKEYIQSRLMYIRDTYEGGEPPL